MAISVNPKNVIWPLRLNKVSCLCSVSSLLRLLYLCALWHCGVKCTLIWYNSRHNQLNWLPVKVPWLTSPLWGYWHFSILSDSSLLPALSSPAVLLITAYGGYGWVFRNSQGGGGGGIISLWPFQQKKQNKKTADFLSSPKDGFFLQDKAYDQISLILLQQQITKDHNVSGPHEMSGDIEQ